MNELLEIYVASLDYPNVSGAEHLELLNIRDQIEEIVNTLSPREKIKLREADKKMLANMAVIHQEISHFINLSNYRNQHSISPHQWWWYLDVLSFLPDKIGQSVA
ncbi:MAG: hypothetical protein ACK58N_20230 [Synechocystis sp.]|jgi:hypothetical protein